MRNKLEKEIIHTGYNYYPNSGEKEDTDTLEREFYKMDRFQSGLQPTLRSTTAQDKTGIHLATLEGVFIMMISLI